MCGVALLVADCGLDLGRFVQACGAVPAVRQLRGDAEASGFGCEAGEVTVCRAVLLVVDCGLDLCRLLPLVSQSGSCVEARMGVASAVEMEVTVCGAVLLGVVCGLDLARFVQAGGAFLAVRQLRGDAEASGFGCEAGEVTVCRAVQEVSHKEIT